LNDAADTPRSFKRTDGRRRLSLPMVSGGEGLDGYPAPSRGLGAESNGAGSRRLRSDQRGKSTEGRRRLKMQSRFGPVGDQCMASLCILTECCSRAISKVTLLPQYRPQPVTIRSARGLVRPGTRSAGAVCRAADYCLVLHSARSTRSLILAQWSGSIGRMHCPLPPRWPWRSARSAFCFSRCEALPVK
jgi:hypothetical protein